MSISEIDLELARARHRAMHWTGGRNVVLTLYLGEKETQEFVVAMHTELRLFKRTEATDLIGNLNGVNVVPVAMPSYYRIETEVKW